MDLLFCHVGSLLWHTNTRKERGEISGSIVALTSARTQRIVVDISGYY